LVGAGVVILASLCFAPSSGVSLHNSILRQCRSQDIEIKIQCRSSVDRGAFSKTVKVTEKHRQEWLLSRFMINRAPLFSGGVHACYGHLVITITTPDATHSIRYDHGNGIYPITDGARRTGFIDLESSVCAELNQYFRSVGFSDAELGISDL